MKYNKDYDIKNDNYRTIKKYMDNFQYEKALDLLVKFNEEYPDDIYGKFDYAKCLIRTNNKEEGIEVLEQIRKKNLKKVTYKVYAILLDAYSRNKNIEKIEELLYDGKKILTEFEYGLLKTKYYFNIGLGNDAEELLKTLRTTTEEEKSKLKILKYSYSSNEYLRKNKKTIEKELQQFLKKKYASKGVVRTIYLKLYKACSNYEEAYKYIPNAEISGVESLLMCYEICEKLNKKHEAKKYLDIINKRIDTFNLNELSFMKVRLLYVNNQKEEAFEICKKIAINDMDAAIKLCEYGVQINRVKESIEVLETVITNSPVNNKKNIAIIERLCSLYIYDKNYEKAYEIYKEYRTYMGKITQEEYNIFLTKKLGYKYTPIVNKPTYLLSQIKEYNFKSAVKHISKHKYENKNKIAHTVFNDDISIRALMKMIQPYLTPENLYEVGIINKYEIDCTNIDINENRLIVGTLEDKNNIVFCFPLNNMEYNIEEEYIDESCDSKKMVVKKGIDRFKAKYPNFN